MFTSSSLGDMIRNIINPSGHTCKLEIHKYIYNKKFEDEKKTLYPVLWIWIRMDPELLPESRSGIIVPDPAKHARADK